MAQEVLHEPIQPPVNEGAIRDEECGEEKQEAKSEAPTLESQETQRTEEPPTYAEAKHRHHHRHLHAVFQRYRMLASPATSGIPTTILLALFFMSSSYTPPCDALQE